MKIFKSLLAFAIVILILSSCSKHLPKLDENPVNSNSEVPSLEDIKVSDHFNWETSKQAEVVLKTLDRQDQPVSGVKVSVLTDFRENGGSEIINGLTDLNGEFTLNYNFPAHLSEVVVATNHIGFVNEAKVPVENAQISFTFGGNPASFNAQTFEAAPIESSFKSVNNTNVTINMMGTYNSLGVPDYLVPGGDYISPEMISNINNALPENYPVPTYHPEYLFDVNKQNLTLTENADVWVTFVSEGAGYKNVLAYYTYQRDFPPQTIEDIESCTVIFPNVSFNGSGGGLAPGDKVFLGNFEEGTVIGWLLMRNGWNQNSQTVSEGYGLLYSNKYLNPEPNPDHQQHVVLLHDAQEDIFVISFEDLIRPGGDNDFNDAIFYATVNPVDGVETGDFPVLNPDPTDTDEDGVPDANDDYPEDPELAFNNYYSSEGHFGTLAFEDLWPSTGDYDFNDLVIDYNFNRITNAQNDVVKLVGKFMVRAIGASFHNGFGFEMQGINPSDIEYVNGQHLSNGIVSTNSNGTEAGQTYATIIVFDDAWDHGFGNTKPAEAYVAPTEIIEIELKLNNPMAVEDFGMAPFNPFIFVNGERGREVHLADYTPTNLVDNSYFGTHSDDSDPQTGKYYKTVNNLPFGLNIASQFDYVIEKDAINLGHLKFLPWVESEGANYQDWYMDMSGYRNNSFIYQP